MIESYLPATKELAEEKLDQLMKLFKDFEFPVFVMIPILSEKDDHVECVTFSTVCEACIMGYIMSWAIGSGILHSHKHEDEVMNSTKSEIRH